MNANERYHQFKNEGDSTSEAFLKGGIFGTADVVSGTLDFFTFGGYSTLANNIMEGWKHQIF